MLHPKDKIYTLSELCTLSTRWKNHGEKVVFTNGCFDILHQGHLDLLKYSKAQGDRLIVALNTDTSVKKLKGDSRPINNEELRSEIMASLYYVDAVLLFDEQTPLTLIESLKPDIIVKGGDYKASEVVGADIVINSGGEVKIFSLLQGHSTTDTIKKIKN